MISSRQEALLEQAREAGRASARLRAEVQPRAPGAFEAGDLIVLPETADLPTEWAVLERRGPRLLMVPADTHPVSGAGDVMVAEAEPSGPLGLRCRFGVWVDVRRLVGGRCTGRIGPEVVAQALAASRRPPRPEDTAAGAEERQWTEVLPRQARDRLQAASGARLSAVARYAAPVAASLLVALGAGFVGGALWRSGRVTELERQTQLDQARHQQELAQANARLEELRKAQEAAAARGGSGPVHGSPGSEPLINGPLAWLSAEEKARGPEGPVAVPPGSLFVSVVLQVDDPRHADAYRLEVIPAGARRPVWTLAPLRRVGISELHVDLPTSLLNATRYRLVLRRLDPGTDEIVAQYALRIAAPERH